MKFHLYLFFFGWAWFVNGARSQVGRIGKCPAIPSVANFDFDEYGNGTWFEVAKFFTILDAKCVSIQFTPVNGTIHVVATALEKMVLPPPIQVAPANDPSKLRHLNKHAGSSLKHGHDKKPTLEHSKQWKITKRNINQAEPIYTPTKVIGVVSEKISPATLRFNYTEGTSMAEYSVLETDYQSYAVIWSCNEMFNGAFHNEFLSVLSRTRDVAAPSITKVVEKLDAAGLNGSHLVMSDQQRCDS